MTKVNCVVSSASSVVADVLIVGVFDNKVLDSNLNELDESLDGSLASLLETFDAKAKTYRSLQTLGKIKAKTLIVMGLGSKEAANLELLRKVAGKSARLARDCFSAKTVASFLVSSNIPNTTKSQRAQTLAEGMLLGLYRFDKYKTRDQDKKKILDKITIISGEKGAVGKGEILAQCASFCRDLQNEPASFMTPHMLADAAKMCESEGVKVTVYDKAGCEKLGLTALLAVNRASIQEPRFVIMEYKGGSGKKVALVGKGITFDSGGLNIKTGDGMTTMKMDMSGAAVVLATVQAAARLKLKINLVGVFAATENMVGGDAYKPGDVVPTFSGRTIEVLNTDAEGRVILADSLAYTEKVLKPDVIIDLATLTGASIAALGSVCAAVMGTNDALIDALQTSGTITGERLWPLPFWQEYHDQVKSDLADVRNLGKIPRQGGAVTAGAFLAAFVEKTPWAHIDIAGPAWADKDDSYVKKGGTGFGIRMLIHFLENFK